MTENLSESLKNRVRRFNVLMVDDESDVLRAIKKMLSKLDFINQVDTCESPDEALGILQRRQLLELRERVHILLSDAHMPSEKEGADFLRAARKVKDSHDKVSHPYTIVYSGYPDDDKLIDVSDARITKPAKLDEVLEQFRIAFQNYWDRIAEREDALQEGSEEKSEESKEGVEGPYETAKFSPLPVIKPRRFNPDRDNHDLLSAEKKPSRFVAFLDMDNTLYEPQSQHTIMLHYFADFLLNTSGHEFDKDKGSREYTEKLVRECVQWEEERKNTAKFGAPEARTYKDGIKITGNLSAAAFDGIHPNKLGQYASRFINNHLPGSFYEYVPPLIQKLRDHGIEPILLTGAPDFLVPHILPLVGLNNGRGMTYKKDSKGDLVVDLNTGLEDGKSTYCEQVNKAGYADALAVGDSPSDEGPFQMAIFNQGRKWDVMGAAVMVNGSDAARQSTEDSFRTQLNKRVWVVPPNAEPDQVLADIGLALRAIFRPMHEYGEVVKANDPKRMTAQLAKYERMRNSVGGLENLENLKRIRDVLEREGLPKRERTAILERFYPPIYVESAVKKGVVNTRIDEDFRAHMTEIGCSQACIDEATTKNREHHEAQGSFLPKRRRSSIPAGGPSTHPSQLAAQGGASTVVNIPPQCAVPILPEGNEE